MINNNDIAGIFEKIADLLELKSSNPFRVRAYRTAARTVKDYSSSISDMVNKGETLTDLSGIGVDLEQKIIEIVRTGKLAFLDELEKSIPTELITLMEIEGLGPNRVKIIYEKLQIKNIDDLSSALKTKKIRELKGFGPKTEQNILEGLEKTKRGNKRLQFPVAEQYALPLMEYLKKLKAVKKIEISGSYRRKLETIGDIDILVSCENGPQIIDKFTSYDNVKKIISKGTTRSSIQLHCGLQVDLRVVKQESYGAALHYFTGSKAHNIAIRKLGIQKGYKINEYGIFEDEKYIGGKTEIDVYKKVDLPYIEPELRENRGEIEAAMQGKLPKLIDLKDIKGDLHTHSTATDGRNTLKEMAHAAKDLGYSYIANTDHSKHLAMVKGLDSKKLIYQINEINELNKKLKNIVILKGIEVDILENGSLDLPDDVLKELDIVVAAIHYKFNLTQDKQTKRVLKAMDNRYFNILAHPSGRLINKREPYNIDMEKIMKKAKETNCIMELNSHPDRLDLNDINCRMAKDMGVKIAISTDSHSIDGLNLMKYGINQAKRGWIEACDVINTGDINNLRKLLKK